MCDPDMIDGDVYLAYWKSLTDTDLEALLKRAEDQAWRALGFGMNHMKCDSPGEHAVLANLVADMVEPREMTLRETRRLVDALIEQEESRSFR